MANEKFLMHHKEQDWAYISYICFVSLFVFPLIHMTLIPSLESDDFNCINKKIGWFGLIVFTRERNWEFSV